MWILIAIATCIVMWFVFKMVKTYSEAKARFARDFIDLALDKGPQYVAYSEEHDRAMRNTRLRVRWDGVSYRVEASVHGSKWRSVERYNYGPTWQPKDLKSAEEIVGRLIEEMEDWLVTAWKQAHRIHGEFGPNLEKVDRELAIKRMEARATTCTPEILAKFADENLPEISGNLSKRHWFQRLFN
jgi:hypothetical protein